MMQTAAEAFWQDARRIAAARLGDESLAAEILETAVRKTADHFGDSLPAGTAEVVARLAKFFRAEVRRRERKHRRLVFTGSAINLDQSIGDNGTISVDSKIDLDTMLHDTEPEIRTALLLRYGNGESWHNIAKWLGITENAIRKRCHRVLGRLRRRIASSGSSK
jgi:DNA-directed RNA polymerase specialized sigma24 family protein